MESPQALKSRIESVKNIRQITKAMELVAATKMRKSQEIALASRPYAFAALRLLQTLTTISADGTDAPELPSLLTERPIKRRLFVVITSDKGLAGAFNGSVLRTFERFCRAENISLTNTTNAAFLGIGAKAVGYLKKRGASLEGEFVRVGDYTSVDEARPIADTLTHGYESGAWDEVVVFSTHFRNALRQDVLTRTLLPITRETLEDITANIAATPDERALFDTKETSAPTDPLIEPEPEALLGDIARHLVLMEVYHIILEANASEHSARRAAMKSASDNARDLADTLGLQYNKSRQARITKEIIEISAGSLTAL